MRRFTGGGGKNVSDSHWDQLCAREICLHSRCAARKLDDDTRTSGKWFPTPRCVRSLTAYSNQHHSYSKHSVIGTVWRRRAKVVVVGHRHRPRQTVFYCISRLVLVRSGKEVPPPTSQGGRWGPHKELGNNPALHWPSSIVERVSVVATTLYPAAGPPSFSD